MSDEHDSQMTFLYDGNGNVGQLVDLAGSVVGRYEYDAFGGLLLEPEGAARDNHFQFSTKYRDDESGLIDFGHRYYSADLGRWMNRDPAGESGGANLYAFLANAAVGDADYLGRHSYRIGSFASKPWQAHVRTGAPGQASVGLWMEAVNQLPYIAAVSWQAAANSQHYLFGHGEPVDLPFGEVIEDERYAYFASATLAGDVYKDMADAMKLVESIRSRASGRMVSTDWNRSQLVTTKWLFALGQILWTGDARYEKGSCLELKLKYHFCDPYDFDAHDQTRNGLLISSQYRRLHDVGLASEYSITGDSPEIGIRWRKGSPPDLARSRIDFRFGGRNWK